MRFSPHFWCGFSVFILRYCGFSRPRGLRFLDYFGAILRFFSTFECDCGFVRKDVAVLRLNSVRFCGFRPSLTPPPACSFDWHIFCYLESWLFLLLIPPLARRFPQLKVCSIIRYQYKCVVYGWDPTCQMREEWIARMGVDRLSDGRNQPFYNVLVEDGTERYAAQGIT